MISFITTIGGMIGQAGALNAILAAGADLLNAPCVLIGGAA